MDLLARHRGHGEGGCEGRVRGAGGSRLGMEEAMEGRGVARVDGGHLRMEEAAVHRGVQTSHLHALLMESRWAGLGPRGPGQVMEREVHDDRELRVFHHGVGKAGRAIDPRDCYRSKAVWLKPWPSRLAMKSQKGAVLL
jgi:hypothetical protein